MAERIRAHDWAGTPLGPIAAWSPTLRTMVDLALGSPVPMVLLWGPRRTQLYNDAWAVLMRGKHPKALGQPTHECFPEIAATMAPIYTRAESGEAIILHDMLLPIGRDGTVKDAWWNIHYLPVREPGGGVAGIFCTVIETTQAIQAEQQRAAAVASLLDREADIALMRRIGMVGGIDIDLAGKLACHRSPEYLGLHGLPPDGRDETRADWLARIHPDDRAGAEFVLSDALNGRGSVYESEYRIVRPSDSAVRWIHARADIERDAAGNAVRLVGAHRDITERKRLQQALQGSEDRQAFLLKLSDTLRPLPDPLAAMATASRMLGGRLGVGRCGYAEVDPTGEYLLFERDWTDGIMTSAQGRYRISDFGQEVRASHQAGRTLAIDDVLADSRFRGGEKAFQAIGGLRASLSVPLIKNGVWVATFFVHQALPRHWTRDEAELVRAVADRTWAAVERARAEAALRESEERQTFLLTLSDALRPLADPEQVRQTATRIVGRHLGANRVAYSEDAGDGESVIVSPNYVDGAPSISGRLLYRDYGAALFSELQAGRTVLQADIPNDPSLTEAEKAAHVPIGVAATLNVPLVEGGRLVALLSVNYAVPHPFSQAEIRLVEQAAERIWNAIERAKAESALAASEAQYRQLFDSIDEGVTTIEIFLDHTGRCTDYIHLESNSALTRLTGLGDIQGKLGSEVTPSLPAEYLERFARIALTGRSERYEFCNTDFDGRWFDVHMSRVGGSGSRKLVAVYQNITERKRSEQALRRSEERQAYLLKLSDVLRPTGDAAQAQREAMRVLGQHLAVNRAEYFEIDPTGQYADGLGGYAVDLPPHAGRYELAAFGAGPKEAYDAGRPFIVGDTADLPISSQDRSNYDAQGTRSAVTIPLRKDGKLAAVLAVSHGVPRKWSEEDVSIIEETAERTWAAVRRARAEAALRESEERFRQFAEASSGALWIRDAATLDLEYVSPAVLAIYGVGAAEVQGDIRRWAALLLPEDRAHALERIDQARNGQAVVHEFRVQRVSDGAFRWIRNTDFPLFDDSGRVQRIGGIAEDITTAKLATEHQGVLLSELQHRVRNIMAVIRSMVARTGESASSVEEYAELMAGRLLTFTRVQAMLTRAANVGVSLATIVETEIAAQAQHISQFTMTGPDIVLSPKAAELMTLALHELATNAVKYGALVTGAGHIDVDWSIDRRRDTSWLSFDWRERGAPVGPRPGLATRRRRGFGSELVEGRIPYELGGVGRVDITAGGAQCHLEFPLREGASLLETDAPRQSTVFGGTLDMTGQADLDGRSILIAEDDYYLASDATRALRGAGAEVLGPCPTEEAAFEVIRGKRPGGAIVDINLGNGPSFRVAEALQKDGVPFVFITGYDDGAIPPAFAGVPRLQKPVDLRQVVTALAEVISGRTPDAIA